MAHPHLLQRNGRYYLRLHVPLDVRRWFGGRVEVRKTLKTSRYETAKGQARKHLYHAERIFTLIRSEMLPDYQIRKLVAEYLEQTLADSEEARASGMGLPIDTGDHAELVEGLELHHTDLRESLALGQSRVEVSRIADAILESAELTVPKDSPEYGKVCREVLKGVIEATAVEIDRLKGNFGNEYDRRASYLLPISSALPGATAAARVGAEADAGADAGAGAPEPVLISTVVEGFIRERAGSGRWQPKSKEECEGVFELFLGIMGDRDVRKLTREDM